MYIYERNELFVLSRVMKERVFFSSFSLLAMRKEEKHKSQYLIFKKKKQVNI